MMNLEPTIIQIEKLINVNTAASVTYAALECRLAIERVCYERLRIAHDYISPDDLKKWQPRDVVKTLIQEVDAYAASTCTLSICKDPIPDGSEGPTLADFEKMEFLPIGTQVGFNPNKLGSIWHALSNLALHTPVPENSGKDIQTYGNVEEIKSKIRETLLELKRLKDGNLLMSSGFGNITSFECVCGSTNKRSIDLLKHGQTINCINPECNESYKFEQSKNLFLRRAFKVSCQLCEQEHELPKKTLEKMPVDKALPFKCEGCGDQITLVWRPMKGQTTKKSKAP